MTRSIVSLLPVCLLGALARAHRLISDFDRCLGEAMTQRCISPLTMPGISAAISKTDAFGVVHVFQEPSRDTVDTTLASGRAVGDGAELCSRSCGGQYCSVDGNVACSSGVRECTRRMVG